MTLQIWGYRISRPARGRIFGAHFDRPESRIATRLVNIEVLRGIAAYLVVFHHLIEPINARYGTGLSFQFGSSGVDIFFVISGLVMVLSTSRGSANSDEFLLRRIARIAPVYWLLTAVMIVLLLAGLKPGGVQQWSLHDAAAAFVFFPAVRADGWEAPLLVQGWTLNYEMFFYLVFAILLSFTRGARLVLALAVVFLTLVLAGYLLTGILGLTLPYTLRFYTNPIILEFVAGCAIGLALSKFSSELVKRPLLLRYMGWCAIVFGCAALVAMDLSGLYSHPYRWIMFGLPAAFIVAGVAMIELGGIQMQQRVLILLGTASYSIYLSHIFVIQAMSKLVDQWVTDPRWGLVFLSVSAVIATAGVGIALHRYVETPMNRWCLQRLKPSKALALQQVD